MPRDPWFTKLIRHFHEHPRGRLHERLFWHGLGLILGALTFLGWRSDVVSDPFALMLGVIALCLFLWGFLPQRKARPPPPLPPGKRGEIAEKVRAMKAEKKRKKAPPGQHPPIRRG